MAKIGLVSLLGSLALASFVVGCSGAEEVEITGEAKSAQAISGKITIEFFDVLEDEQPSLAKLTLDALGPFEQVVEAESDRIRVFALADGDGDGKCSEGEAWGEVEITVKEDGTTDPVDLELGTEACPAPQAAE